MFDQEMLFEDIGCWTYLRGDNIKKNSECREEESGGAQMKICHEVDNQEEEGRHD